MKYFRKISCKTRNFLPKFETRDKPHTRPQIKYLFKVKTINEERDFSQW